MVSVWIELNLELAVVTCSRQSLAGLSQACHASGKNNNNYYYYYCKEVASPDMHVCILFIVGPGGTVHIYIYMYIYIYTSYMACYPEP